MATNQEGRYNSIISYLGNPAGLSYNEAFYLFYSTSLTPSGDTINGKAISFYQDYLSSSSDNINDLKQEFANHLSFNDYNSVNNMGDPLFVATPAFWYDSTYSVTSTGGAVSAWENKGAGASLTQGTTSNKPTTNANTLNSKNILDFDGNDYMSAGAFGTSNDAMTAFIVARVDDIASTQFLFTTTGGLSGFTQDGIGVFSDRIKVQTRTSGGGQLTANSPVITTGNYIITAEWNNGAIQGWLNAQQAGWTNNTGGGSDIATDFAIGGNPSGSLPLTGGVAEAIIYDQLLSTAQRGIVETYLSRKWGISIEEFLPTSIPNLVSWYDPSDPTTVTIATGISQLDDKSESTTDYNLTQASALFQPLLISSAKNGLDVMECSLGREIVANNGVDSKFNSPHTICFVYSPLSANNSLLSKGDGFAGFADYDWSMSNTPGGAYITYSTGAANAGQIAGSVTPIVNDYYVVIVRWDGTTDLDQLKLNVNSTLDTATAVATARTDTHIMKVGDGSADCRFGDIFFYDRVLSDLEVSQLQSYLSIKWDITL